ncbi:MAG: hypothetical protein PVI50_07735 [Gammaproteobacteria bacterium]|jgi:hypothetical protein
MLLLSILLGTVGAAGAGEYRVYAPVVNVEPIYEIRYEAVTRRVCSEPEASRRTFTEVAATIGGDIRRQQHLWQQRRTCRNVTEHLPGKRLTAYQVTYRYRGHTATTRLDHDPGERIPVRVSLSPLR